MPLFIIISIWIALDSHGGVIYRQVRVGQNNKDFRIFKFRSMRIDADKKGGLTIGFRDSRITQVGYYLRKYKLDELPQLINVFTGDMSLVGPRPEIRKYVDHYTEEQKKILTVRPGITDWASIDYINENELLGKSVHPEKTYLEEVMPAKIALNRRYIDNRSVGMYFRILGLTIKKMARG